MKIVIDIPEDLYNNIRKGGFWLESGLTLSDAYDFIKYGTPVPNEDKWVPVSERLPDNNDEYLVIDADGNFGVGYYREDAKAWDSCNWGWLERSNNTDDTCPPGISKVIAWMPLPESYKG